METALNLRTQKNSICFERMKTILAGEVLDSDQQRQQDILHGGARCPYVKWSDFLMMNVRQDSSICCLIKILNPKTKIV